MQKLADSSDDSSGEENAVRVSPHVLVPFGRVQQMPFVDVLIAERDEDLFDQLSEIFLVYRVQCLFRNFILCVLKIMMVEFWRVLIFDCLMKRVRFFSGEVFR